jgi:hypothetical protein
MARKHAGLRLFIKYMDASVYRGYMNRITCTGVIPVCRGKGNREISGLDII